MRRTRGQTDAPPHAWLGILWCVWVAGGCAGYQVGTRTLYRTDIRTVHVPIFASDSLRPDVGEWLTEAVIKEIEARTPYKVVSDPLADSVLTGRLLDDRKRVIAENINDEPRNLLFSTAVHITWIDNGGRILAKSVISLGDDFVVEAGQSISTAQQAVVRRLAAQIVSEMESPNW